MQLNYSVNTICPISSGFALVGVKDRLIAISIGKNSLEAIKESDQRYPEIWSIRKMASRADEFVLGTKDGLKFINYN